MPQVLNDPAALAALIAVWAKGMAKPFVVALDGRSGAGKSTLARTLADRLDAALIEGDDFYAGGIALRDDSPQARASACIDWMRQRRVLEDLRCSRVAVWQAFDWDTFDGRLCYQPTRLAPKPIVILEGVYAARPELADAIDLRVLLVVADETRTARLLAREGVIGLWERQWHEAEAYYFENLMPSASFDVIVKSPRA